MATVAPVPAVPGVLANRSLVALVCAQSVSRAGDALLSIATVWLVLDLTNNNPVAVTAALAFEFLPFLLFGLLGGALADRWERRRTMITVDLLRGLLLLIVPLLAAADVLALWHIFTVTFVLSSLGRMYQPARQAIVPDLVSEQQLVRANALLEGAGQAAWVAGPALGGILVSVIGAPGVYYLDAASFGVSALLLTALHAPHRSGKRAAGSLRAGLLAGVRHVRASAVLSSALLLGAAATAAFAPVPALLSVLVRTRLDGGARLLGLLMACFFLGSIGGSVLAGKLGPRLHRGLALALGALTVGGCVCLLAAAPVAAVAAVALAATGAGASLFNVSEYSLLQAETPPELRGRVASVASVSAQALRPAALMLAGLVAGAAGVRIGLSALAVLALIAWLVTFPILRSRR